MGVGAENQRYTIPEYLRLERDALDKHEYRNGEILTMGRVTGDHSLIAANIIAELGNRLKGKPCRVYESSLRLRVPRKVLYTYPDVSVVCGKPDLDPDDPFGETVTSARVIIEVLSPSTESYDRGEKFNYYRELDSLEEYVLVSQAACRIETFFRQSEGTWLLTPVSGLSGKVNLRSLEVELALSEVYAGVEFPEN
jgi:Uma2 family endonuclease